MEIRRFPLSDFLQKRINDTLWKRAVKFKDVNFVYPAVDTLQKLWDSVNKKEKPTVKQIAEQVKTIIQAIEPWTDNQLAKDSLSIYVKLSRTSPEIFSDLLTEKRALVKTEVAIFWAAAVQVLGENFELEKDIYVPIAKKLQTEKKNKSKKLTWDFSFNGVPSSSTNYLNGKKEVRPPKKVKTDPKNKRSNSTFFRVTIPPLSETKDFLKV